MAPGVLAAPLGACCICHTGEDALDNLTGAQLLINQCGHKFCKQCSNRKFSQKSNFLCPLCSASVKKSSLSDKTLDEIEVADDLKVRKRINEIYNKSEHDFETSREYHDYQELKEDIIYELVHGVDKVAVEARVKAYKKENAESIRTRLAEANENDRKMDEKIKLQKQENKTAIKEVQELDALSKKVDKELKRQELQIRMGERTELSADLVAKQKELSLHNVSNNNKQELDKSKEEKRKFSSFMSASAAGLSKESDMFTSGIGAGGVDSGTATLALPKIAEQFLSQGIPPRCIPPSEFTGRTGKDQCREAGGFDSMTEHHRNYYETFSQLKLITDDSSTSHWVSAIFS